MKFIIIIMCSLLMLLGCSLINGPSKPKFQDYQYPLEVGNSWTYERTITHSNVQPDTVQLWFPLLMKGSAEIKVSGIDTLGSELDVYVLKATAVDSMNPQFDDSATFFFRNEEDGLFEYGSFGSNMAIPVSRPPTEIEIKQYFSRNIKSRESFVVSSNSEVKQSIKYPIELNSSWLFIDTTNFIFSINKKIVRFESLKTKVGTYSCFVVEWIYSTSDISVIDYVSEIGLLKRTISAKNIHACSLNLTECVTFDMVDEYLLVDFNHGQ